MAKHSVNFGRWLERLGFKDGLEPDIIRAIQPVQVVQDVSGLLPPTLPPSGAFGGQSTATAAIFSLLEVFGGTRGGTLVSAFFVDQSTNRNFILRYASAPLTLTQVVTPTVYEWQAGRTMTTRIGNHTSGNVVTDPRVRVPSSASALWEYYVPPSQFAYLVCTGANVAAHFGVTFSEFEAAPNAQ